MTSKDPERTGGLVRRIVARAVFGVVYLCVLLLVAEGAVRLLTDTIPPLTVRDPVIGRRYRAGFSGRLVNPESKREVDLRFNALGFRGPEWAREKPAGTVRIAVLGDSMIAALSVDEHETLVGILQAKLAERFPDARFEVMNFGVSGSSNWQEFLAYREVVRDFAPDLVLCSFFAGNDLVDNSNRLTSSPRIYFDFDANGEIVQLPFSSGRAASSRWLNAHSRFYVWQKQVRKGLRAQGPAGEPSLSPEQLIFATEPSEDVAHAWRLAEAALTRLRDAVEADGARFLLFLMPCATQVYDDLFAEVRDLAAARELTFEREEPERRLARLAADHDIAYLDLVPAFRAAAPSADVDREDEWLFHGGRWHLNERGNAVAAEAVFAELARERGALFGE